MTLSAPIQRFLVLGPTFLLSLGLSRLGYPPLPRLAACLGLGAVLIGLITLYKRRGTFSASS